MKSGARLPATGACSTTSAPTIRRGRPRRAQDPERLVVGAAARLGRPRAGHERAVEEVHVEGHVDLVGQERRRRPPSSRRSGASRDWRRRECFPCCGRTRPPRGRSTGCRPAPSGGRARPSAARRRRARTSGPRTRRAGRRGRRSGGSRASGTARCARRSARGAIECSPPRVRTNLSVASRPATTASSPSTQDAGSMLSGSHGRQRVDADPVGLLVELVVVELDVVRRLEDRRRAVLRADAVGDGSLVGHGQDHDAALLERVVLFGNAEEIRGEKHERIISARAARPDASGPVELERERVGEELGHGARG